MKKRNQALITTAAILFVSMNLRPAITSIAPFLETIQAELGLNSASVSLLTAIPVLCMGFFAPAAPVISRRIGLERTIRYCLLLIAVATGLRYWAHNNAVLLLSAALLGIGLAVAGPSLSGYIKRNFAERAPAMIGVYSVGIGLGASLGAGITIPLQQQLGISWSTALASWSLLAVASLLIWLYASANSRIAVSSTPSKRSFPWRNKRAILILLFFGLQGSLNYSVTAWLVPIAMKSGLSLTAAGTVVTVFAFVQMASGFLIPVLVSKHANRLIWMLSSSVVTLIGLLLLSFVNNGSVPWISAALLGVGTGALFFLALLLPLDNTSHAEDAAAWTSMVQCGGYILAGSGPALTGWIVDMTDSYANAFIAMSGICVVMMMVCLALYGGTISNNPNK